MSLMSLMDLPREIIYLIFQYLNKEHIIYSFFELNNYFSIVVKYFIDKQFNLANINNDIIFHYCLSNVLPLIGSNLRYLTIGYPYGLSIYINSLKLFCPNLEILRIYCCYSKTEDIRLYLSYLIHPKLQSLIFLYNNQIVGKEISYNLLNKSTDEQFENNFQISSSLILHLSSIDDLILLKRYSESNYLSNDFYMIECLSNGEWLTDSKDDLCIMSNKYLHESIFFIKQIDEYQCSLEYELYNVQTQSCLTVLKLEQDEERWISSSILSTQRKQSINSCSRFTFEKIHHLNSYYIRPCYSHAKRLQVSGKRVIVSFTDNQNILNYSFKLHRIS